MNYPKTIDLKISELCNEIDDWKQEAEYWKNKFKKLEKDYCKQSDEDLKSAQKGVANALMFALHVEDDADGNLKINKENRKIMAEPFKC